MKLEGKKENTGEGEQPGKREAERTEQDSTEQNIMHQTVRDAAKTSGAKEDLTRSPQRRTWGEQKRPTLNGSLHDGIEDRWAKKREWGGVREGTGFRASV